MKLLLICIVFVAAGVSAARAQSNLIQTRSGCSSSEESDEEQDRFVEECWGEVQEAIMLGLDQTMQQGMLVPKKMISLRSKRDVALDDSPAVRRMAGCVFQCMFRKNNVLGEDGVPTRRGLMSMMNEGVTDRGYFLATTHIVDHCYGTVKEFRNLLRTQPASGGQYCDLAYNVVDCVSDEMDEYCEGQKIRNFVLE